MPGGCRARRPRWLRALVQIAVGVGIATQPYHGWIGWWRGEIDPSGSEIEYLIGLLVVGFVIAFLGVYRMIGGEKSITTASSYTVVSSSVLPSVQRELGESSAFSYRGGSMARLTVVKTIDDIDGKELSEAVTIRFGVDGKDYEFDTSPTHAEQFHASLAKYIEASRRAGVARGSRNLAQGRRPTEQNQAIRHWAQANGYEVGDRGRIPVGIVEAFEAAH